MDSRGEAYANNPYANNPYDMGPTYTSTSTVGTPLAGETPWYVRDAERQEMYQFHGDESQYYHSPYEDQETVAEAPPSPPPTPPWVQKLNDGTAIPPWVQKLNDASGAAPSPTPNPTGIPPWVAKLNAASAQPAGQQKPNTSPPAGPQPSAAPAAHPGPQTPPQGPQGASTPASAPSSAPPNPQAGYDAVDKGYLGIPNAIQTAEHTVQNLANKMGNPISAATMAVGGAVGAGAGFTQGVINAVLGAPQRAVAGLTMGPPTGPDSGLWDHLKSSFYSAFHGYDDTYNEAVEKKLTSHVLGMIGLGGITPESHPGWYAVSEFLAETATDPLSYTGFGLLSRLGKIGKIGDIEKTITEMESSGKLTSWGRHMIDNLRGAIDDQWKTASKFKDKNGDVRYKRNTGVMLLHPYAAAAHLFKKEGETRSIAHMNAATVLANNFRKMHGDIMANPKMSQAVKKYQEDGDYMALPEEIRAALRIAPLFGTHDMAGMTVKYARMEKLDLDKYLKKYFKTTLDEFNGDDTYHNIIPRHFVKQRYMPSTKDFQEHYGNDSSSLARLIKQAEEAQHGRLPLPSFAKLGPKVPESENFWKSLDNWGGIVAHSMEDGYYRKHMGTYLGLFDKEKIDKALERAGTPKPMTGAVAKAKIGQSSWDWRNEDPNVALARAADEQHEMEIEKKYNEGFWDAMHQNPYEKIDWEDVFRNPLSVGRFKPREKLQPWHFNNGLFEPSELIAHFRNPRAHPLPIIDEMERALGNNSFARTMAHFMTRAITSNPTVHAINISRLAYLLGGPIGMARGMYHAIKGVPPELEKEMVRYGVPMGTFNHIPEKQEAWYDVPGWLFSHITPLKMANEAGKGALNRIDNGMRAAAWIGAKDKIKDPWTRARFVDEGLGAYTASPAYVRVARAMGGLFPGWHLRTVASTTVAALQRPEGIKAILSLMRADAALNQSDVLGLKKFGQQAEPFEGSVSEFGKEAEGPASYLLTGSPPSYLTSQSAIGVIPSEAVKGIRDRTPGLQVLGNMGYDYLSYSFPYIGSSLLQNLRYKTPVPGLEKTIMDFLGVYPDYGKTLNDLTKYNITVRHMPPGVALKNAYGTLKKAAGMSPAKKLGISLGSLRP